MSLRRLAIFTIEDLRLLIGVALGFALSQFGTYIDDQATSKAHARQALIGLAQEMSTNASAMVAISKQLAAETAILPQNKYYNVMYPELRMTACETYSTNDYLEYFGEEFRLKVGSQCETISYLSLVLKNSESYKFNNAASSGLIQTLTLFDNLAVQQLYSAAVYGESYSKKLLELRKSIK